MSDKLTGTQLIHITHFFNPNFFLFKLSETVNLKLVNLENEINKVALDWRKNNRRNLQPKVNDIVAYHIVKWDKWIRARVCSVMCLDMEILKYKLWAIDHGCFVESSSANLAYLPGNVRYVSTNNIYHGGVYDYTPIQRFRVRNQRKLF